MATNGWIGEQTVHSWGTYNSRLTTNVYINGIRRYSDHIDVSGVIYLFCKSSGARTVWYDWAITAWCGGRNLGQIKQRTYNNNILGKSWSKNFSIRINCSNSATSATFKVGFSDSNMGGKDKYWTLYFDRYATSPSGITSVAGYTQYSTISTSCSGINWGQGYSSRKLTCIASYTYNGKTENFTLGTWTDGATSKSVTKTDFNFPADLNVTVKWTASTNIGSTSSTTQVRAKQTFPAPNLSNTTFTAESTAPYCIRVNVSGVDFGDNYLEQKLELYGTYELDGIIYDNKLGEVSNQTSWTLEYDASQEAEPWTKIPDDSLILLRLVADNGNRTSDKIIIINCQSSYEAYVIEHISEEEKEKSETYTGKSIQIQNAPKDAPLADFKLDGETSQQTYTGKNLFVLSDPQTKSGITLSKNTDGTINLHGTSTSSPELLFTSFAPINFFENGATYTLSCTKTLSAGLSVRAEIYNDTTWLRAFVSTVRPTAAINTTSGTKVRLSVAVSSGATINIDNLGIQLEKASQATAFEPYVGGVPVPNPDYPQAVQTVTGENEVKICGKNLYPFSDTAWSSSDTSAGWYFQDGAGSAWGVDITSKTAYKLTLPAGTYTATAYNISSNVIHIQACANGSPNEIVITSPSNINRGNPTSTITLTETTTFCLRFRVTNPSLGIGNTKIQIEKGTATTYEPYQGQSYEVNLGKNLAKMANGAYSYPAAGQTFTLLDGSITATRTNGSYQGGAINISTGVLSQWSKNCASDSHLTGSGGTYTLTFSRTGDVVSSSQPRACIYGFIYDNDGNNTSGNGQLLVDLSKQTSGTYTLNLAANRHLGALVFYSQYISYSDVEFKVQLEKGSQATSYAAYFEPIELCKIGDYQDYIYKSGEKWYVRKETGKRTYTADDITIAASDTYSNVRYAQFTKGTDNKQYGNYTYGDIINFFTHGKNMGAVPAGGWNSYISDGLIYNSAMQDNYWCSFAKSITLATMKEKLNGMVAYYALATPTDTEITNEALIEQLDNVASAPLYTGVNNIFTITSNEQGTLEIQYFTKWQNTSPAILSANGRNGTGNFKQIRRIGTK